MAAIQDFVIASDRQKCNGPMSPEHKWMAAAAYEVAFEC